MKNGCCACAQGAPQLIFKSHSLSAMTLEFKKECGINSVLQSLSSLDKVGHLNDSAQSGKLELDHNIQLQNQSHILLRGKNHLDAKKCLELEPNSTQTNSDQFLIVCFCNKCPSKRHT